MGAARRFAQNPGRNAICYYRYSSDAQRDASIDQQQQAAHDYADAHGYHIIREYADHAISGTRDDREQYNLMLYEVERLKPAYLILWKTDRLSRDKIDIVLAKKRLRECGVKIVYIAEAIPEDDEATEVLLESIYEGMAAAFIASHRKNVMRGLSYNAERALYNGVKVLGYKGQPDKPYEIDPDTVPIVRRIYEEYAAGIPLQRICNNLAAQGLKSSTGKDFTINTLRHILTNQSYIGIYRWGDYETKDGMPRIISDELFQKVQDRLAANQRGGKGALKLVCDADIADYWLSGYAFCGLCGESMQGIGGTSKSGKVHHYYSCKNHRKHKCSMPNLRKDLLEKIVLYILQEVVENPANKLLIAEKCYAYYKSQNDDHGVYEASIKAQLKDAETKINNLMKAIEAGIFTETTAERLKMLESTKHRLEDALLAEQNRQKCDLTLHTILKWLDSFTGDLSDTNNRKEVMDDYLEKILVFEDKLVVTFKYINKEEAYSFVETSAIIDNRQAIMDLFEKKEFSVKIPKEMLEIVSTDESEEDHDFFP